MGSHRNRARKRDGIKRLETLRQHLSQLLLERCERYSTDTKKELEEEISRTRQNIAHLHILLERNGTFILPAEIKSPERKKASPYISPRCRKVTLECEKPSSVQVYFDENIREIYTQN